MGEYILEGLTIENKEELIVALMDQYGQDLLQLSYSYVKNHAIAEELTQEIFIKIYKYLDTYQERSSIKTWCWRIAINHCKDYLRSWNYRKVVISEVLSKETLIGKESIEEEVIQRDEDSALSMEVLNLPIKYREVIHLHYFADLSIKEIERVTGINQNTIKTRLKRAKELLKKRLEERL